MLTVKKENMLKSHATYHSENDIHNISSVTKAYRPDHANFRAKFLSFTTFKEIPLEFHWNSWEFQKAPWVSKSLPYTTDTKYLGYVDISPKEIPFSDQFMAIFHKIRKNAKSTSKSAFFCLGSDEADIFI